MTKTIGQGAVRRPSRRDALKAGGAAAVGAGLFAIPLVSRAAERLVVNSHGGQVHKAFQEILIEPFKKKFGVEIVEDLTPNAPQTYAKIRAARGAPGFDVAAGLSQNEVTLGARERLLEQVTEREVPNLKYCYRRSAEVIPPFGIVHNYYYLTLVYNPNHIEAPRTWRDYWAPGERYGDRIKGHVLAFNPGTVLSLFALVNAARLGGGGIENMEPAWEMLKAQRPYHGAVVAGSPEAAPMFENGQIWIAPFWNYRAAIDIERGLPLKAVPLDTLANSNGAIGLAECTAIPIGATNKRLAYEFMNFRLDRDVQRQFSLAQSMGPARSDITDLPAEFAAQQLTREDQMDKFLWPDPDIIGAKRREWTLKWQQVMAG